MPRVLSGIKPTGTLNLGGYFGAVKHWVALQETHETFISVVDLHALTVEHNPKELNRLSLELATTLLAAGLDPQRCSLFVQSHIRQHAELAWLMQCVASIGELRRMTQFKDKSDGQESVSAGLFTYPALMAADVLLYDTDLVPVGEDQRQHLELTRDLALRFNHRFGETFTIPQAMVFPVAARVMDLQNPNRKMSKSVQSPQGTIDVLDEPATIKKKISRAVTDTDGEVRFDPAAKPGVSNLLELLGAATDRTPQQVAADYSQYGPLKADTASALTDLLAPIRQRHAELSAKPDHVLDVLRRGKRNLEPIAQQTYSRASKAIGLIAP